MALLLSSFSNELGTKDVSIASSFNSWDKFSHAEDSTLILSFDFSKAISDRWSTETKSIKNSAGLVNFGQGWPRLVILKNLKKYWKRNNETN